MIAERIGLGQETWDVRDCREKDTMVAEEEDSRGDTPAIIGPDCRAE